jgi:hypothetical protein
MYNCKYNNKKVLNSYYCVANIFLSTNFVFINSDILWSKQ